MSKIASPAHLPTVRLLGRLLGDVIRTHDGAAVFDQIEALRQASVAFHRNGTAEAATRMEERLGALSLEAEDFQALTAIVVQVARAHCEGRLVSCLEGGYDVKALAESVKVHLTELLRD